MASDSDPGAGSSPDSESAGSALGPSSEFAHLEADPEAVLNPEGFAGAAWADALDDGDPAAARAAFLAASGPATVVGASLGGSERAIDLDAGDTTAALTFAGSETDATGRIVYETTEGSEELAPEEHAFLGD